MRKRVFLYSHEYRDQKIGGKSARNYFSSNTRIVRAKKLRKKSSQKVRKHVFYIHTNIVTKKWGWGKNARNNCSRNTLIVRAKNVGRESSEKSPKTSSFICTRISCPKNKGKKTEK